jgi:conserved oligomeric Golgi complex subunit 6
MSSSATVTTAMSQPRNPISLRLYKVLGTNYSDDATREALQTLSELYYTSPQSVPGQGKDRDRHADEDDDLEYAAEDTAHHPATRAPKADEPFRESVAGESAARARKHLRRDMENKLADGSRQFLAVLGEVDQVCVTLLAASDGSQYSRMLSRN